MNVRLIAALLAVIIFAPLCARADTPQLNLAHERFVLRNGLTLIVQEDRSAPIVSVGVWYRVGSRNEAFGQTGLAHLFEHLMFNGSENFDGEWYAPMREIGAAGVNGTTSPDRTSYVQTIPTTALDRVLWMESDRMGHLLGAVTQAKLDEQRGVVENEKRQGENEPYGRAKDLLYEGLFPLGHPYRHSIIGSREDLWAASLQDVHAWFARYYGPNNAVVVLVGDIAPAEARARVEHYFGDIAAGPDIDAWTDWQPNRLHDTRETLHDAVASVVTERGWVVPQRTTRDRALLDMAATVLGDGQRSRFHRELVEGRKVASAVGVEVTPLQIASVFNLSVTLNPGEGARTASEAIDQLMAEFLARGPTSAEVEHARARLFANAVRRFETAAARGQALAEGELYAADPSFAARYLQWINDATPEDVRDAARRHLSRGSHQVDVLPRGDYSHAEVGVDRTGGLPPAPDTFPAFTFPEVRTATLSNGARIAVVHRPTAPSVQISAQFEAGFAADAAPGGKEGVSSFAMKALDRGTLNRDATEIADEAGRLGASIRTISDMDVSIVSLWSLKAGLDRSLELWADVLVNASFPDDAIERLRNQQLASILQERADPDAVAERILPPIIYGSGHPYAFSYTGSGTETTTRSITRADLLAFRDDWLRPDNVQIFVVGDITLEEIQPALERVLRGWRAPATPVPTKVMTELPTRGTPRVILVDRPGAPQSLILGWRLGPRGDAPDHLAIEAMNAVFGGGFNARLNMNLREDKHWSYGVTSGLRSRARGPRPFFIRAPVQTDRTADALREIIRELTEINATRPIQQAEMRPVIMSSMRQLPALLQGQSTLLENLAASAALGRPLDYAASLEEHYQALDLEDLRDAARTLLAPDAMTWVIVGDRTLIEAPIAALGIAPIEIFTPDGLPAD